MAKVTTEVLTKKRTAVAKKIHNYSGRKESHKKSVKRLKDSILHNKKVLTKLEKTINLVRATHNAVAVFTGITLKDNLVKIIDIKNEVEKERILVARGIFCKYLLEKGVDGSDIQEFMGEGSSHPSYYRSQFTKSFRKNPDNKQKWINFKAYLVEVLTGTEDSFIDNRKAPGS